jgi:hypothetical protein
MKHKTGPLAALMFIKEGVQSSCFLEEIKKQRKFAKFTFS